MRFFLIVAMVLASQLAHAEEGPAFPQLDTPGYCAALVSAMLVKAEQQVERQKCLADETAMRTSLEPYWYLVTPDENQRLLHNYMKEVRYQTYFTVGSFVATALGEACVDGRVSCSPGEPTAEGRFTALQSDDFCSVKFGGKANDVRDCIDAENKRKASLGRYWATVLPDKRQWCLQYAHGGKFPPFRVLSNCVADDIGYQCLKQQRQCRPG